MQYTTILLKRNNFTSFVLLCLMTADCVSLQDSHRLNDCWPWRKPANKDRIGLKFTGLQTNSVQSTDYGVCRFYPSKCHLAMQTGDSSDTSLEWPLSPSNHCSHRHSVVEGGLSSSEIEPNSLRWRVARFNFCELLGMGRKFNEPFCHQ